MNEPLANRPRLLMLAFACRPDAGSEPGLGWNRALQAAKFLPTWVLCDEEENRAPVERYLAQHGAIENLHFIYVPPSRFEQQLKKWPGLYYPAYNRWHRRAFRIAQQLHGQLRFDLMHQLNLCGFREPGYLWKFDSPLVWGPIGGAQNYPWRFLSLAGIRGALSESVRNVANLLQMRFSPRVGRAARKATAMLAANSTNARELAPRRGNGPVEVMVETGVHPLAKAPMRNFHHDGPLRILWSGVMEHRKALHILLYALAKLPPDVKYELRILGRGPLAARWKKLACRLGIDVHCQWIGWLDRSEVAAQYEWADLFAFTSLRDTTGNVVLESFAAGTPVLCFDHQGMADIVTGGCGIKIPVST
ncbi:MAG TPA: glycosyltransferase, partial [Pirellulales bacterium]